MKLDPFVEAVNLRAGETAQFAAQLAQAALDGDVPKAEEAAQLLTAAAKGAEAHADLIRMYVRGYEAAIQDLHTNLQAFALISQNMDGVAQHALGHLGLVSPMVAHAKMTLETTNRNTMVDPSY